MRMTPSSTCPVNPTPLCHLPPSPTASQKLNLDSPLTSLNLTVIKQNSSSLVPNPLYPKLTVSPSPLTAPPSPRAPQVKSYETLIISAHLSPLTPLLSWFTVSSPPAMTTVSQSSLVPLTNPSTSSNCCRTLQLILFPQPPPFTTSLPSSNSFTGSWSNSESFKNSSVYF